MSMLMGNAPRHPGLWQDASDSMAELGVSNLPSSSNGRRELQQLSGQLAQLSQQGRWIVLINPGFAGYKTILANAGVRMDRVLQVHARDEVEALWATERALTSGTTSAVVSWVEQLDSKDKRRLQLVAKSARALGIVLETHSTTELQASCWLQAVH